MLIFLCLISTILLLGTSFSPLKLSLMLTYISIVTAMMTYKIMNSSFIPSVMMISFSSGMMILFSYCSIMCSFKEKSSWSKSIYFPLIFISSIPIIYSSSMKNMPTHISKSFMETFNSNSLIFMMFMVIITMVGINNSFFNPTKKFMASY